MIGRADIEGSKSDVAMNAWPPQARHLRYRLTGVPPQSNSPPATVPGAGHARRCRALNTRSESPLGARLPASPARSLGCGFARYRIPLVRTSSKSAARRQPRRPAGSPRERDPNGRRSWGDPREGPGARPESPPPTAVSNLLRPAFRTASDTAPRPRTPAPRHRSATAREPPERTGLDRESGGGERKGDGTTAPPAAARAQPRFAPQPDRPSP
ncbi:hypothetical protein NQZ68_040712 [Dissostichus eleginoides]|nr:hypothetical protein NQZ68_040712 [Dissostichus eleginoides]